MSEQNPNGQQLPMSWPQPTMPAAPPFFGTTPPAWTGATAADATAIAQAQSVAPQTQQQIVTGLPVAPGADAAQLVSDAKANAAEKKAKKALEAELRKKWATPWDRFNGWLAEFQFTIDVSADETNHKLPRWIGPGSSLGVHDVWGVQTLPGERVWWNPAGFDENAVKKCWEWMGQPAAQRPELIVQIRPANQTEQPFWMEYVEAYRDWNGYQQLSPLGIDFRVRFLTPRVEFVAPPGIKESSPRSGHVLLIWRNLWAQQPGGVSNG